MDAVIDSTFSILAVLELLVLDILMLNNWKVDATVGSITQLGLPLIMTQKSSPSICEEVGKKFTGFASLKPWFRRVFLAMITTIVSAKIFATICRKGWVTKLPDAATSSLPFICSINSPVRLRCSLYLQSISSSH